MDLILQGISNHGFPMVLSVYLLVRLEKKLDGLTASLRELTVVMRRTE